MIQRRQLKTYSTPVVLFKVNNRNIRTRCEICSKLTIKIPYLKIFLRTYFTPCSSVSIVNFEYVIAGSNSIYGHTHYDVTQILGLMECLKIKIITKAATGSALKNFAKFTGVFKRIQNF